MTLNKKFTILVSSLAGVILLAQYLFFPIVNEINIPVVTFSLLASIALVATLFNLKFIKEKLPLTIQLFAGFSILFIALWLNILDEIFAKPDVFMSVLASILWVVGILIVIIVVNKLVQIYQQQNEELFFISITDDLTGLFSRRYFGKKSDDEFKRCKRNKKKLSILLIDLDHLDENNKNQGAECRNIVLQTYSNQLKKTVRMVDTVARWNPDQLIMLAVECDAEGGKILAEKLELLSHGQEVKCEDTQQIKMLTKIGISTLNNDDKSIEQVIIRAEKALNLKKIPAQNKE